MTTRSIERALLCIEILADSRKGWMGLTEMSNQSELDKATVSRILKTLLNLGYVEFIPEYRGYRMTAKILTVASSAMRTMSPRSELRRVMESLSQEFGETVNVGILNQNKVVYIDKIESMYLVRADLTVGMSVPLWCAGLGKAILSQRPDLVESVASELRKVTPHTISDMDHLRDELDRIREQGFAVDNEEYILGLRCVAVAIRADEEATKCAVSVAGPVSRITPSKAERIGLRMRELLVAAGLAAGCPGA